MKFVRSKCYGDISGPGVWSSVRRKPAYYSQNPYQVIGVDFAGPLTYRLAKKRQGKAYVLLNACSLTRGIYLDLLRRLEGEKCIRSLKRHKARSSRPECIYSDNGRTFVAAAKWIKVIMQDGRCTTSCLWTK